MPWSQRLLSAFFLAVLALKVAEGVGQLDAWPLSPMPMFSRRVPPQATVWRVTLQARRGDAWIEIGPAAFALSDDELLRRLPADPIALPVRCGELGRLYNAGHPGPGRLHELRAVVTKVPRPGSGDAPVAWLAQCPLEPPPPTR